MSIGSDSRHGISPPQVQRTLVRFLLGLVNRTTWLGLGKHCGLAHNNYIAYETSAPLCTQCHLMTLVS